MPAAGIAASTAALAAAADESRRPLRAAARFLTALLLAATASEPVYAQRSHSALPGREDRVSIEPTAWPWSAIGRINRAGGGFCTGTLIGPRHVLTAAHCLYDRRQGRWSVPQGVHFVAGYRLNRYLAHGVGRTLIIADGYRPGNAAGSPANAGRDWAIVVLAEPLGLQPIPWRALGYAELAAAMAQGPLVQAGYRQDRAHILSADLDCRPVRDLPGLGLLLHDCAATLGDSGSPLLLQAGGEVAVVAVHVGEVTEAAGRQGVAVPAASFAAAAGHALETP